MNSSFLSDLFILSSKKSFTFNEPYFISVEKIHIQICWSLRYYDILTTLSNFWEKEKIHIQISWSLRCYDVLVLFKLFFHLINFYLINCTVNNWNQVYRKYFFLLVLFISNCAVNNWNRINWKTLSNMLFAEST